MRQIDFRTNVRLLLFIAMWWANKQLEKDKKMKDYVGRNEKTKVRLLCDVNTSTNPLTVV